MKIPRHTFAVVGVEDFKHVFTYENIPPAIDCKIIIHGGDGKKRGEGAKGDEQRRNGNGRVLYHRATL